MCRARRSGSGLRLRRRFRSKAEVRDRLRAYADELEEELTAVEERIAALEDGAGEGEA